MEMSSKPNTTLDNWSNPVVPQTVEAKKKSHGWLFVLLIVISVIWLSQNSSESGKVYESLSAAAIPVREALMNHEKEVTVRYRSDTKRTSSILTGILSPVNQDLNEIYDLATEHTGNPNGGDQLSLWTNVKQATMTSVESGKGYINTLRIELEYSVTKEQEEQLRTKVASVVRSLNLTGKTDYEKVRLIYQWICNHVTYDYAHLYDEADQMKYTAYNAAIKGTAVCSGYAQLFYRMALSAGLEARIQINDSHAWNLVKLGGQYYYCDTTWDSGLPESQYQYFLKGQIDFSQHPSSIRIGLGKSNSLYNVALKLPVSMSAYSLQASLWR